MKTLQTILYPIFLVMATLFAVFAGGFVGAFSVDSVGAQELLAARVNPLDELNTTGQSALGSNTKPADPRGVILIFVGALLSLTGLALTLIILYAGTLWFTARGNDDQVTKAKDALRNAIIGMIIVAMSYALVTFLVRALFNPQGGISCAEMFNLEQGSATEIIAEQVTPFCGS